MCASGDLLINILVGELIRVCAGFMFEQALCSHIPTPSFVMGRMQIFGGSAPVLSWCTPNPPVRSLLPPPSLPATGFLHRIRAARSVLLQPLRH
jgi:hypothetical protein